MSRKEEQYSELGGRRETENPPSLVKNFINGGKGGVSQIGSNGSLRTGSRLGTGRDSRV